jgi:anti-sigma B factor antagonist
MPTCTTHIQGEYARVTVSGPMTIYEAIENKRELLEALAAGNGLEIDLSDVDEVDTAGLQLLLLAHREGSKAGKPVRLAAPGAALLEVLERYGLQSYFSDASVPGDSKAFDATTEPKETS